MGCEISFFTNCCNFLFNGFLRSKIIPVISTIQSIFFLVMKPIYCNGIGCIAIVLGESGIGIAIYIDWKSDQYYCNILLRDPGKIIIFCPPSRDFGGRFWSSNGTIPDRGGFLTTEGWKSPSVMPICPRMSRFIFDVFSVISICPLLWSVYFSIFVKVWRLSVSV